MSFLGRVLERASEADRPAEAAPGATPVVRPRRRSAFEAWPGPLASLPAGGPVGGRTAGLRAGDPGQRSGARRGSGPAATEGARPAEESRGTGTGTEAPTAGRPVRSGPDPAPLPSAPRHTRSGAPRPPGRPGHDTPPAGDGGEPPASRPAHGRPDPRHGLTLPPTDARSPAAAGERTAPGPERPRPAPARHSDAGERAAAAGSAGARPRATPRAFRTPEARSDDPAPHRRSVESGPPVRPTLAAPPPRPVAGGDEGEGPSARSRRGDEAPDPRTAAGLRREGASGPDARPAEPGPGRTPRRRSGQADGPPELRPRRLAGPADQPRPDAPPAIHVSIGRVEVRAVRPEPAIRAPVERPRPMVSLEEYLERGGKPA